jgi:hypothetical protein
MSQPDEAHDDTTAEVDQRQFKRKKKKGSIDVENKAEVDLDVH